MQRATETKGHADRRTQAEMTEREGLNAGWCTRIRLREEKQRERERGRESQTRKETEERNAAGLKRSQGERRMIVSMITMERGRDEKGCREMGGEARARARRGRG